MSGVDSHGDREQLPRGPSTWLWITVPILALAVLLREPSYFFNPQFWAEDGVVFFTQSREQAFLQTLLAPFSGYLHTFPRLVAGLAVLFPLKSTPLIFNLAAYAVQILPILYLLSRRLERFLPTPTLRLVAAALYVAVPNSNETFVNLTNSQWNLTLAALLALLADSPASRGVQAAELGLLALFALTGPFGILLLPCAALNLYERRRDPAKGWWIAQAGILAAGAAVQAAFMLGATRSTAGIDPSVTLEQGLQILATHAFFGPVLGINRMVMTNWAASLVANRTAQLLGLALLGLLIVFVMRRRHRALLCLLYLACVTIAISFLFPLNDLKLWLKPSFGPRYYLFATCFVLYAVLLLCLQGGRLRWLGAGLALMVLAVGIPGDFQHWHYRRWNYAGELPDTQWPDQVAIFESLPQGASLYVPIQPIGAGGITMRKKTPGRSNSPLAGLSRTAGEPAHGYNRPTFKDQDGQTFLVISGWVAGLDGGGRVKRVWLTFNGRPYPAVVSRFWVGSASDDRGRDTKFQLKVPMNALRPGRHRVSVIVLTRDGSGYSQGPEVEFALVAEGDRLVTTDVR
jgi:hypothetical protein